MELLRSQELGRIAMCAAHTPDIFPVNYAVDNGTIVFRTAEGTKLAAVHVSEQVAFEMDGYVAAPGDAWSVVVKGTAHELPMYEVQEDDAFWLFPWSATVKSRFVRVTPEQITGRRFHVVRTRPSERPSDEDVTEN